MRLPSFIKLPKNRKFNFPSRHYDPSRDDLEQRISNIKNNKKKFFERSRNQAEINTSKLQLIIAFILSFLIFGWILIGNKIFIFTILIPLGFILKKIFN